VTFEAKPLYGIKGAGTLHSLWDVESPENLKS
jgi:hypothetical protein